MIAAQRCKIKVPAKSKLDTVKRIIEWVQRDEARGDMESSKHGLASAGALIAAEIDRLNKLKQDEKLTR